MSHAPVQWNLQPGKASSPILDISTLYSILLGFVTYYIDNVGGTDNLFHSTGGKWGFVDNTGRVIVEPTYDMVHNYSAGLAAVNSGGTFNDRDSWIQGGKWGFIDKTGKVNLSIQYADAGDFSEGLAAIKIQDKGWGFIDYSGKVVILPQFAQAQKFSEGLAPVSMEPSPWGSGWCLFVVLVNLRFCIRVQWAGMRGRTIHSHLLSTTWRSY